MKQTKTIILMALVAVGAWLLYSQLSRPLEHPALKSLNLEKLNAPHPPPRIRAKIPSSQLLTSTQTRQPAAIPPNETTSLAMMTETLERFTQPRASVRDLVDYLEGTAQRPIATHNRNPYTGEMAIVRTEQPLPGTRYFHAQYFSAEDGSSFVQHMSFEFKPGPNAMDEAVLAVQKSFSVSTPSIRRNDYAQWPFKTGYILWVKKLAAEDLKDDPFNAYTTADVGTIRVAIELEVH